MTDNKNDESTSEKLGTRAPDFLLPDQNGKTHKLSDYQGRYLVVYFYPKDSTPGCTAQSCGFRDNLSKYEALNAAVVGVSILGTASKAKFAKELGLSFPLLADEDHAVSDAYGVWGEKQFMGKTFMGIKRETFVVAPDGRIAAHWQKAKGSEEHSVEVMARLKELQTE